VGTEQERTENAEIAQKQRKRLLNALIAEGGIQPGANRLLYVVIGDPALQPLEKMTPVKP
jgi:hypothetical protein